MKVNGETVLRSDDAETILEEMYKRIESTDEESIEQAQISHDDRPFSNVVHVGGQIVDWLYHEIPTVKRTEMHLEGHGPDNEYDSYIENVIVRIEGGSLPQLRHKIERELEIRDFMYQDVFFELLDIIHNGTPCLVLQIIPRQMIPLTPEREHTGEMPPELQETILGELRKDCRYTYTKTVIQKILSQRCRCKQIRYGIDLVELILTQEEFTGNEKLAVKMCLEYLSDTREGKSLLGMWNSRDLIRTKWNRRDIPSRAFISQVYEWFRDIRTRECNMLSRTYRVRKLNNTEDCLIETTRAQRI